MNNKKRYLKKNIEMALSIILMIMFIITCMVDSFELSFGFMVFMIMWFSVMFVIYKILNKYGKGVIYEN